jgi:hypothetical protein
MDRIKSFIEDNFGSILIFLYIVLMFIVFYPEHKNRVEINNKLDLIVANTVTYEWETTIQAQHEVIVSLEMEIMELGAQLDSMHLKYDY